MWIKGLVFNLTCCMFPEQYDVFDENEKVGYVRLRHGELYCCYPDADGEVIYYTSIGNENTGAFESKEQRVFHLNAIADEIINRNGEVKEDE